MEKEIAEIGFSNKDGVLTPFDVTRGGVAFLQKVGLTYKGIDFACKTYVHGELVKLMPEGERPTPSPRKNLDLFVTDLIIRVAKKDNYQDHYVYVYDEKYALPLAKALAAYFDTVFITVHARNLVTILENGEPKFRKLSEFYTNISPEEDERYNFQ